MKFSMLTWPSDPAPGEAKLYLPGLALASAMNSCMVLAGTLGCTANTLGIATTLVTGAKSLIGSYLSLGYTAGLDPCVLTVAMPMV
ncbi:hypothetical protein D9M72_337550 [compost metagenome]